MMINSCRKTEGDAKERNEDNPDGFNTQVKRRIL